MRGRIIFGILTFLKSFWFMPLVGLGCYLFGLFLGYRTGHSDGLTDGINIGYESAIAASMDSDTTDPEMEVSK